MSALGTAEYSNLVEGGVSLSYRVGVEEMQRDDDAKHGVCCAGLVEVE